MSIQNKNLNLKTFRLTTMVRYDNAKSLLNFPCCKVTFIIWEVKPPSPRKLIKPIKTNPDLPHYMTIIAMITNSYCPNKVKKIRAFWIYYPFLLRKNIIPDIIINLKKKLPIRRKSRSWLGLKVKYHKTSPYRKIITS